jgi:hypothetical protein
MKLFYLQKTYPMNKTMTKPKPSGLIDWTDGKLKFELLFARKIKDQSLVRCLKRLRNIDRNTGSKTTITNDFAPHSFEFCRQRRNDKGEVVGFINGGIIFHGAHDGYGSGAAPTFSVSIDGGTGWQIHT